VAVDLAVAAAMLDLVDSETTAAGGLLS